MSVMIEIDENSGFCFGVINAIRTAELYLQNNDFLYCLGDIVHNNEEVARLSSLGLKVISHEQFQNLSNTTVLIRAHGEPPQIYEIAAKNNIQLIDATCPVVLKLQRRIRDEYLQYGSRKQILIFGKKGHAEVIGLLGQTDNQGVVLSSEADVSLIDYSKPSKLYSQTTQNLEQYYNLIDIIKREYDSVSGKGMFEFEDTVCRKVSSKAKQIAQFAAKYDLILFVTGEKSSNGKYLSDVCKSVNSNTFIVTQKEQLKEVDFSNVHSIGICGATSTPMWLMQQIADECSRNFQI